MFGGLHTEMYAFNVLGDMLDNSGWTGALTQANVASYNMAVFFPEGVRDPSSSSSDSLKLSCAYPQS